MLPAGKNRSGPLNNELLLYFIKQLSRILIRLTKFSRQGRNEGENRLSPGDAGWGKYQEVSGTEAAFSAAAAPVRPPKPVKAQKLAAKPRNGRRNGAGDRGFRRREAEMAQVRVFQEHEPGHHEGD